MILKIKKLLYEEGFTIAGAKRKIRDMEREESRKFRLRLVEQRSEEKERELLFAIREELKGIQKMLEESSLPSY